MIFLDSLSSPQTSLFVGEGAFNDLMFGFLAQWYIGLKRMTSFVHSPINAIYSHDLSLAAGVTRGCFQAAYHFQRRFHLSFSPCTTLSLLFYILIAGSVTLGEPQLTLPYLGLERKGEGKGRRGI